MDLGSILGKGADALNPAELVELLTKHKDDLATAATVAKELPKLLTLLATGLGDAGEHAARAGRALSGASGATGRVGQSAATVGQISGNLGSAGKLVTKAADEIAKVPLMGIPAGYLASAAQTVGDSIDGLDSLAANLAEISVLLDTVGGALELLGESLGATGRQASAFVG